MNIMSITPKDFSKSILLDTASHSIFSKVYLPFVFMMLVVSLLSLFCDTLVSSVSWSSFKQLWNEVLQGMVQGSAFLALLSNSLNNGTHGHDVITTSILIIHKGIFSALASPLRLQNNRFKCQFVVSAYLSQSNSKPNMFKIELEICLPNWSACRVSITVNVAISYPTCFSSPDPIFSPSLIFTS